MTNRWRPFQKMLAWFLVSVVAVLLIIVGVDLLTQRGNAAVAQSVVTGFVFLGLAWVVLGWMFTASVETYAGPGAMEGIPIIWPTSAIPERNRPMLEDLASKLGGQSDMGSSFAVFGFLLMAVGIVFYAAPWAGVVVIVAFLSAVTALLLYTLRPMPAPGVN